MNEIFVNIINLHSNFPKSQKMNSVDKKWIQPNPEAVLRTCSVKKLFFEISQNSQEYTFASLFFNKVSALRPATLLKKKLAQLFFCEFCEISKNTFFIEHLSRVPFNSMSKPQVRFFLEVSAS